MTEKESEIRIRPRAQSVVVACDRNMVFSQSMPKPFFFVGNRKKPFVVNIEVGCFLEEFYGVSKL